MTHPRNRCQAGTAEREGIENLSRAGRFEWNQTGRARRRNTVRMECMPKPDPESCSRIALASLRKAVAAAACRW
jgi:hypothetical protein